MYYRHDIEHCNMVECPQRKRCYRYNAFMELVENGFNFCLDTTIVDEDYVCKKYVPDDVKKD